MLYQAELHPDAAQQPIRFTTERNSKRRLSTEILDKLEGYRGQVVL